VIYFGFDGIDFGLVNQNWTKMETVKREGIDIVFAMDVSKVCLPKMLLKIRKKVSRLFRKSSIN
jgi:hypothetical protein